MEKRMRKLAAVLATAALATSMLAGCGGSSTGGGATADGDTILIAGIAPLTGSLASWGEGAVNGYNLAIEEINAAGGVTIDGKSYKLESAVFAEIGRAHV